MDIVGEQDKLTMDGTVAAGALMGHCVRFAGRCDCQVTELVYRVPAGKFLLIPQRARVLDYYRREVWCAQVV